MLPASRHSTTNNHLCSLKVLKRVMTVNALQVMQNDGQSNRRLSRVAIVITFHASLCNRCMQQSVETTRRTRKSIRPKSQKITDRQIRLFGNTPGPTRYIGYKTPTEFICTMYFKTERIIASQTINQRPTSGGIVHCLAIFDRPSMKLLQVARLFVSFKSLQIGIFEIPVPVTVTQE